MDFKKLKISSEEEWLRYRQKVLTASDVPCLFGYNRFKSAMKMWEDKQTPPTPIDNVYVRLGQWLEPLVVDQVNKKLNKDFVLCSNGHREFYISEEIGLGATPDAASSSALLECKTTKPANWLYWENHPPLNYLVQLYVQLLSTNKPGGYLAVLTSTEVGRWQQILDSTVSDNFSINQPFPEFNSKIFVYSLTKEEKLTTLILGEVKRFWETVKNDKAFRVNKKQAKLLELLFRFNLKRTL